MLAFVDSLHLMFVLLHIVWLPQRFWSTNRIVDGQWARPTLRVVQIVLSAIIVGSTTVATILEGVTGIFFLEVGSGLVRSSGSLRFGALDYDHWSTHDSLLQGFGSPLHELSTHGDSFLEAFGSPFHDLSTHGDWYHPDTEQNKGINRRIPYSKRDPRVPPGSNHSVCESTVISFSLSLDAQLVA